MSRREAFIWNATIPSVRSFHGCLSLVYFLNRAPLSNRNTCKLHVTLRFLVAILRKKKETSEVNFNNIFCLTQYI